jgi:benzoyl-CoA 2,3-dioxygenase component A
MTDTLRQHLIDPEVCIRCNTCEETCPIDAISHDANNYVVDAAICNSCNDCLGPCPTGAIDSWRQVARDKAYSLTEQLGWEVLPDEVPLADPSPSSSAAAEPAPASLPADIERITTVANAGQGGVSPPPWSAAHPYVNLHPPRKPVAATVSGNFRLTGDTASSDIRHIVLDFGSTAFPVLEGQTIGVVPPGVDAKGKPHMVRLYSVASPRDGERPRYNNLSLTVKRVTEDHDGQPTLGIASNFLCDLKKGDTVQVVGPYGDTFLMPNHPGANLIMICTGTGSAPMRAMTERRRRRLALKEGGELMLFFGARTPDELPYFGPLTRLPKTFIDINFAFSRQPDQPKCYVQDRLRERGDDLARLLADDNTYIYICGLKGMERGVEDALDAVCRTHDQNWASLRTTLRAQGRYHVETY